MVGQTASAEDAPRWGGREACGATLKRQRLVRRAHRRRPLAQPTPQGVLKPLTNILSGHTPPRIGGVHSRPQEKAEREHEDLEHREGGEVLCHSPRLPGKGPLVTLLTRTQVLLLLVLLAIPITMA